MTNTTDTPPYRTKLIEVGLPLEAINAATAREKNIRHGHPSTLHLYWARRPLAACRAVLFASLVDDPSADPPLVGNEEKIKTRRQELHHLLVELVQWENSNNEAVLNRARGEIASSLASRAAEVREIDAPEWKDVINRTAAPEKVNKYLAEIAPPVLDPFAGGGSIPLEAQRLGLRAYASDLNPVAVLITKALIEIPPKFAGRPPVNPEARAKDVGTQQWKGAQGLAEDVRYYGRWMRDEAEKRIGHLYPKVKVTEQLSVGRPDLRPYIGQELTVIAWIWARTVRCPNPACGHRAPIIHSFWLSRKKNKEAFVEPRMDAATGVIEFDVLRKGKPMAGTSDRNGARCLFCGTNFKKPQLREISCAHGLDPVLMAIVADGKRERIYLPPTGHPLPQVTRLSTPEIDLEMTNDKRWFSPPLYGLPLFSDLFSNRQLAALCTFSDLTQSAREQVLRDDPEADGIYPNAVATYLGEAVSKLVVFHNTLAYWRSREGKAAIGLGRQALAMCWDFVEMHPFAGAGGDWENIACNACPRVLTALPAGGFGEATQVDARRVAVSPAPLVATDPPYYDNIGYADLSDLFYVWLKRTLGDVYPELFRTLLTPKADELIASRHRHNGNTKAAEQFFEVGLEAAFAHAATLHVSDLPLITFYAYKQSESDEDGGASTGWETFLRSLIANGLRITATIPIRTEQTGALKTGANVLASSIVLACRPRPQDAGFTTRSDFVRELRARLATALTELQQSSIAPVDLQQAAIGPGMAVFSKYKKVLEADGSTMTVRTALALTNQVLDAVLTEQEGEFDADTRFAVVWFGQHRFADGPYGAAETLSKAKAVSVKGVVEAGILMSGGGKVRLLRLDELATDWSPETDDRLTVWEVTHHLCRRLHEGGIDGGAQLIRQTGPLADSARDLAYRLYSICERNKWAEEAQPYNALVVAWPEMQRAAAQAPPATAPEAASLFEGSDE